MRKTVQKCAIPLQEISTGLYIGMSFLWESHGKHPMGWHGTAPICISNETVAML